MNVYPPCPECGGPLAKGSWEMPCCGDAFDCTYTNSGIVCATCDAAWDDMRELSRSLMETAR